MRFRIKLVKGGDDPDKDFWWEDMDQLVLGDTLEDVRSFARDLVRHFNSHTRPYQKVRLLLDVEALGLGTFVHDWYKVNLVTELCKGGYGSFDRYECRRCGITGKRYGLANVIDRDPKYKAKKYANCKEGK